MVEPTNRGGDVALFIDWENFKISLAAGNRNPNLSSLKEEVANQGRVVVAKAYADWVTRAPELRGASQFINDPPSLYAAGIEPVFVPTRIPSTQASSANGMRTYRVKNSVDVKMTADCIECAHSYPNIGTFVLVSGDSDFLHVVNALRTMGKQVVIVGVSWSTSRRLADQVDSLLLYDKDVDPIAPQPAVLPQHAARTTVPSVAGTGAPADALPELAEVIRAIEEIIRDERAAGGQPLLTAIKQRMMRRYPNFDEKKLGFSGFKKLMARAAEDGNIKLVHSGLVDWAILADEEIPEGTTEESPAGVASRSSRRRGGRRRYGSQRDSETTDGVEEADDTDSVDDDAEVDPEEAVPAFAGELEETAATDFDLPDPSEADDSEAEVAEDEVPMAWFDADEEAGAAPEFAAAQAEEDASDTLLESEQSADAAEPVGVFGDDHELAAAVQEVVASLSLPEEPADGLNPERVSDLIVMADHLEHRQGARHVAFTYLVDEVCGALEQGLEAGNPQIAQHWTDVGTKDYVSKALRGLSDSGLFKRSIIAWRVDGQRRQRRIINLVRDNDLVGRVLVARLGPGSNSTPPADPPQPADEVELPAQDEPSVAQDNPPMAESFAPVNGNSADEPEPEPQPVAEADDEPQPAHHDADDDVFDEPQPRSTRRRRPFTSRLLGR